MTTFFVMGCSNENDSKADYKQDFVILDGITMVYHPIPIEQLPNWMSTIVTSKNAVYYVSEGTNSNGSVYLIRTGFDSTIGMLYDVNGNPISNSSISFPEYKDNWSWTCLYLNKSQNVVQ